MGRIDIFPPGSPWTPLSDVTTYMMTGAASAGSTSSASMVDFPGPVTKTVRKVATATAFIIHGHVSCYKTTNAGTVDFGLLLNGVDYWMTRFFFNSVGVHMESPMAGGIGAGLAPGEYVVTLRWRTGNAAANVDTNDFYHISFRETMLG